VRRNRRQRKNSPRDTYRARFIGQSLRNLLEWADRFGGLLIRVEEEH
jgi:hypothetical protein